VSHLDAEVLGDRVDVDQVGELGSSAVGFTHAHKKCQWEGSSRQHGGRMMASGMTFPSRHSVSSV
jgi:hypothetical protein